MIKSKDVHINISSNSNIDIQNISSISGLFDIMIWEYFASYTIHIYYTTFYIHYLNLIYILLIVRSYIFGSGYKTKIYLMIAFILKRNIECLLTINFNEYIFAASKF